MAILAFVSPACGDDGTTTGATATASEPYGPPGAPPDTWRGQVVTTLAHDTRLFTQGLEIDGSTLYESTGLYGQSAVRAVDRTTGTVLRTFTFPANVFAEGLTRVGDQIIVLSWQEHTAFVLDAATFAERGRVTYDGEGWGICALGGDVVTSDGSDVLTFRDPATFVPRRTVDARLNDSPVRNLNELECANGAVYANVWKSDRIVRIDPQTGAVSGVVDLPELRPPATTGDADAVLNGIAYDTATGTFLLTGKRWPVMYDVRFVKTS